MDEGTAQHYPKQTNKKNYHNKLNVEVLNTHLAFFANLVNFNISRKQCSPTIFTWIASGLSDSFSPSMCDIATTKRKIANKNCNCQLKLQFTRSTAYCNFARFSCVCHTGANRKRNCLRYSGRMCLCCWLLRFSLHFLLAVCFLACVKTVLARIQFSE